MQSSQRTWRGLSTIPTALGTGPQRERLSPRSVAALVSSTSPPHGRPPCGPSRRPDHPGCAVAVSGVAASYLPAIAARRARGRPARREGRATSPTGAIVSASSWVSGGAEPDVAVGGLDEVDFAESPALDEVEYEPVDLGPDWLHEVEGERVPPPGVRVHDAEAGVEPDDRAGEHRFGLDGGRRGSSGCRSPVARPSCSS